MLDRLGALGDLPEQAVHMAGTVIRIGSQERLRLALPAGDVFDGRPPLVISQVAIEARLRERLAALGGHVEWGRNVVDVVQDEDKVDATFSDGSTCRAGWLVGCDGARSRSRQVIGLRLKGSTAAERFLLADLRVRLPVPRDYASMWVGESGSLATIPLPGRDQWRLMGPLPTEEPDTIPADHVVTLVVRSLRKLIMDAGDIEDVTWTSTFRIHRRLAEGYRKGRVFLAGDAAHTHSPVGGQGMNIGIGDAENLAWKLALVVEGRANPALLDSYEAERRPVAEAVVNTVGGINTLLLATSPPIVLFRDRLLLPLVNRPRAQRSIWWKSSQLGVTYRKGPLARQRGPRLAGRRPGDRVPDLKCQRADGSDTRLHAELRGRWVLLSAPHTTDELAGRARDRLGTECVIDLHHRSLHPDTALLVRPDAHIGWQGTAAAPADLDRWLRNILNG